MALQSSVLSFAGLLLVASALACSSDGTTATGSSSSGGDALANAKPVVDAYAVNVHAAYVETLDKARALKTAVDAFVAAPSAETHQAAKTAWIASRGPYSMTEAFRFYGGPIDDELTGPEGEINAWPLDENFIDYTRDEPEAGMINHPEIVPEITKDILRGKNEQGGEKNIATGYHAIEFLLWGQDDIDPMKNTEGQRPFTDYVTGGAGTAKNQDRRGAYLKAVADMLVEDLEKVTVAWEPNKDNYAKTFAADTKGAITKMLTGIGALSNAELSGERMTVAYKDKSQEDEHSCFSDTTSQDLLASFTGIVNVYYGKQGTTDAAGLDDLVKVVDPALDAEMTTRLSAATAALQAMQSTRFDVAIASPDGTPARDNVLKAIQAIKKVAETTVKIGTKLGVTFKLEEPSEAL